VAEVTIVAQIQALARNFHMVWVQPFKKNNNKQYKTENGLFFIVFIIDVIVNHFLYNIEKAHRKSKNWEDVKFGKSYIDTYHES